MKTKILFFLIIFSLISTSVLSQEKCYCDPVPGYFKEAGILLPGEEPGVVPDGYDLWVRMKPAAQWNTKERGGCRLRPGEKYVAKNGKVIRVDKCGNPVVESEFIKHEEQQVVAANGVNITINCDTCPKDPDLRKNYEGYLDINRYSLPNSGNDDYLVLTEDYAKVHYPELENNQLVEKTWFGRNWYWVIPVALLVGYAAYDGFTQGGLFDFFKSKTRVIIIDPNDTNGNGIPDHNENGQGLIYQGNHLDRPIVNDALDGRNFINMQPQIRIPVFGFSR